MTKRELEQVYYLRKELKMWQGRLSELEADIALSPKIIDGMPYSKTNAVGSPTEVKAMRLAELAKVIEGKISEIQIAIGEIEAYILSIDDSLTRQVIELRCCSLQSWKQVALAVGDGYTADSVRQLYHRYVKTLPKK